jgi:hypothetical protein
LEITLSLLTLHYYSVTIRLKIPVALGASGMIQRLGVILSDGSMLVLPERADLDTARKEAKEHNEGESNSSTRVVRLDIKITEVIDPA